MAKYLITYFTKNRDKKLVAHEITVNRKLKDSYLENLIKTEAVPEEQEFFLLFDKKVLK